jgi:hypothetical protein
MIVVWVEDEAISAEYEMIWLENEVICVHDEVVEC